MVFNRKPEVVPTDPSALQPRRNDRAAAAHLSQVGGTGASTESVIGNDLTIEGQSITIRCKGSLRINGNIQADLHSRALEVGKDAQIQGAIAADTVNVYGHVSGAILGARVVLHASAEVEGDIHSEFLSIEQGASFDGRSRKVRNLAEIAPQLERATPQQAPAAHPADRNTGPQPFGTSMSAQQQAGFVN